MIKKQINQNYILNTQLLNLLDNIYLFGNKPIKRIENNPTLENTLSKLKILQNKIQKTEIFDLKTSSSKIVFGDGNIESSLMIIGDAPSKKDSELGKPFVGNSGNLLNKMLKAIKIDRKEIYLTNVVNYQLPNDRKPEKAEIYKYSEFLKEHISIIDPKILILMGSIAMEALLGSNNKISNERGKWKEIIIKQKSYKAIVTFHPDYLLRLPDQKKFSWEDLKIIRKEIDNQLIIA